MVNVKSPLGWATVPRYMVKCIEDVSVKVVRLRAAVSWWTWVERVA